MRGICVGLVLLVTALPGCASPDSESPGFLGNYGGFPWESLMRKNSSQNSNDTWLQHPEYAPAGRFAKSTGTTTTNPAAADPSATAISTADLSAADPAPPAK